MIMIVEMVPRIESKLLDMLIDGKVVVSGYPDFMKHTQMCPMRNLTVRSV